MSIFGQLDCIRRSRDFAKWIVWAIIGVTWTAQVANAQVATPVEWAGGSPPAAQSDRGLNSEASTQSIDSIGEDTESATRTPIQRSQTSNSQRESTGNARSTSWIWAWIPIGFAAALWWLVGRLRSDKVIDQGVLPDGVIAPLGRRSVGGGQVVQLIRIGSRILVVTPTTEGLRTLTEITDPQEVERLVALCLQPQQANISFGALFRGQPMKPIANPDREAPQVQKTTRVVHPREDRMSESAAMAAREVGR